MPNGSGNDLCGALSINTFESGLEALVKGQTIKIDICKTLLDYETEEEIKGEKEEHLRYCLINTSLLLIGATAKNGAYLKPYIGKTAYTF